MKIFLPFTVQDIGGTSTFARKFQNSMAKFGHEVTFTYTPDYDLLFLIVQCPLRYLLDAKRRGRPIVQRLDGTYYWSVSGWKFPLMNAKAAYIRHFFTDFTIYQSRYSQECANRFLGVKRDDRHAIIYNGVDLSVFSPKGASTDLKDNPEQQVFFTASAFRRVDQIAPIIAGIEAYRQRYTINCKLVIAGTFVGKVRDMPHKLQQLGWVQLLGKVANHDLPRYERSANVFCFTHLNPPCPNNIIESLACDLPVCGINDGAMEEIVTHGQNGQLLAVRGTGFWRQRAFDAQAFADNLHRIIEQQHDYARQSRAAAQARFSLNAMAREYGRTLESLV